MKVVDCFIFYNELAMLDYRLNLLQDQVDYFVIVEAPLTFVGNVKEMFFTEEVRKKYAKFDHKIIHIVCDTLKPRGENPWNNETTQRNAIALGVASITDRLEPTDLIMISDLDEIPNMSQIRKSVDLLDAKSIGVLEQKLFYYNFHCVHPGKWTFARVLTHACFRECYFSSAQKVRTGSGARQILIPDGGWHLSYFGDANFIRNKIENFSHQEFNNESIKNAQAVQEHIDNQTDLYNRADQTWCKNNSTSILPPGWEAYLAAFW